ncbi:hypothetical protein GOM71_05325 [Paenibacillus sp. NEAU-GSW1]|nr:hypothetical protein [Paenibacillus sp. NEAU-GSW1]
MQVNLAKSAPFISSVFSSFRVAFHRFLLCCCINAGVLAFVQSALRRIADKVLDRIKPPNPSEMDRAVVFAYNHLSDKTAHRRHPLSTLGHGQVSRAACAYALLYEGLSYPEMVECSGAAACFLTLFERVHSSNKPFILN